MADVNVIVVSSVRPEPSIAAALTLHRHLVNRHGIRLYVFPAEHHELAGGSVSSKIVPRLMRGLARQWANDVDYLMHTTLPLEKRLAPAPTSARTVVLTLAYRSGCWVAQRYEKRYGLPSGVRLDDLVPAVRPVNPPCIN